MEYKSIPEEQALKIQFSLSKMLNTVKTINDILEVSLEACLEIKPIDCGAAFVIDSQTSVLHAVAFRGASEKCVETIHSLYKNNDHSSFIREEKVIYAINLEELQGHQAVISAGLSLIACIPIRYEKRTIALLMIASGTDSEINTSTYSTVEILVEQIGGVIARIIAEEELNRSRERLQHALDAAHEGIWDINFETGKVFFSDRAFRLIGYSIEDSRMYAYPEDPLGYMSIDLLQGFLNSEEMNNTIHPDDRETIYKEYDNIKDTGRVAFEARFKNADGSYTWIEMIGKSVTIDDDGNLIRSVGTFSDISHRKEMEQDRKKLELELIQMEEQTKLNISQSLHDDLGSHLSMIKLNIDSLIKDSRAEGGRNGSHLLVNQDSMEDLSEMIIEAVKKCRYISSSLYPLHVIPGKMSHFIQRLRDIIALSPRPVEFIYKLDESFHIDPDKYTQLLYIASESVTNAIKHSDCSLIKLEINNDSGNDIMTISDNGIGLNTEEVEVASGGQGMKIMEYRASLMDWSINISSSFKDGTTVQCHFGRRILQDG